MDASLKQRLVGAVVLVALGVIFLPMLVKGPAPDSGVASLSLRVPAAPDAPTVTSQDLPLVQPGAAPAGGAVGMPASVAEPAPTEPDPAAAAGPAPLAAVAAGGFAVSFGSYANAADADKVIAALRNVGLPGYREPVVLGTKQAQRVRIGPFGDRATAESARLRAGQVPTTVEAKVLTLDAPTAATSAAGAAASPAASAPQGAVPATAEGKPKAVAEPPKVAQEVKPAPAVKPASNDNSEPPPVKPASAAGTGFVVQIGAFASASDAQAQRDALRKAGFNTFTDTVPGPNGSLTRVRVGPVISRAEAEALKAKLKASTGKDGMVRPHP